MHTHCLYLCMFFPVENNATLLFLKKNNEIILIDP